jgi:S-adenosylmethionine:tRNA ribosyltransferase-isomerase
VEILLLEALDEEDQWLAWGKSNRPVRVGERIHFVKGFEAEILGREGRKFRIQLFSEDATAAVAKFGHTPLPPYISRADSDEDRQRYQTIYARHAGAVAAPTAGLHFTPEMMAALEDAGASTAWVTLHVGPGTFQPVQVEKIEDHVMHEESYHVPEPTANAVSTALAEGRRIVAVGTTSLRAMESAAVHGRLQAGSARTALFIYPGYRFRTVSALLTNFHLPRSTLLMLVCAFAGSERILDAYRRAIAKGYRFFSYGDAMFVEAQS